MQQSSTDPWPNPNVAWYGLAVLLSAFLVSAIDRVILGMLIIPIKADLGVSDAAMGALLGISFAVAFTLMGLVAGWLADRYSRRGIVSIAIAIWSLATAACGLASSFLHLLIGRIAVASGEAALSPAAFSLISDYFPPKKLGRALGVYMSGAFIGAGISFLIGGAVLSLLGGIGPITLPVIGDVKIWQVVFLVVGLPGLIVAFFATTIKEPVRRGVSQVRSSKAAVFGFMKSHARIYTCHLLGYSLLASIIVNTLSWSPTMFGRAHGFTPAEVGLKLGLILLFLSPSGVFAGGWLVDRLQKRGHADAPLLVGILAALVSLPFGIAGNLVSNGDLAVALYCPLVFFACLAVACGPTAIQLVTPNEFRGQISAGYLMSLNIITSLFGATGVGLATDYVFRNEAAVGSSMALMCVICGPLAAAFLWYGRKPFRLRVESIAAQAA